MPRKPKAAKPSAEVLAPILLKSSTRLCAMARFRPRRLRRYAPVQESTHRAGARRGAHDLGLCPGAPKPRSPIIALGLVANGVDR